MTILFHIYIDACIYSVNLTKNLVVEIVNQHLLFPKVSTDNEFY